MKGRDGFLAALTGVLFLAFLFPAQRIDAAEGSPYYGITIDGEFSDWEGVKKHPGALGINETACIFDGDYLYIYIDELMQPFSATWSGTHSNGKFTLVTDLGYETLFQLKADGGGSVAGVEGVLCAHSDTTWGKSGYYWEIAIPVSNLGAYNQTVSFGHYLAEDMYVTDVANISKEDETEGEENSDPEGSFDGIAYDGNYDDWTNYPHVVIEYATAGTQEEVVDAQGALYSTTGFLFGHVVTYMQAHLNEGGGEFTSGITIRINDNENNNFYPQMVAVDENGNINYNPQLMGLSQGTYEFYIIDAQGGKTAANITQWTDPAETYIYGTNAVYGKMMVTIGPSKHDMEYWMDISALADKFQMEPDDVKTISVQYGKIGQQWVKTAGASTGPVIGMILCSSVFLIGAFSRKRKGADKAV